METTLNVRQRLAQKYPNTKPNDLNLVAPLEFMLSFIQLVEAGEMMQFAYRPHLARSNIESLGRTVDVFFDLPDSHWIKRTYSPTEIHIAYNEIRDYYRENAAFFEAEEHKADVIDTIDFLLQTA
jgi:hypothetical protein